MTYTTLIATVDLSAHLENPTWAIVDCRFRLDDKAAGRQGYLAGHIPGAVYAHLDEDLSSPIIPGKTGRHPLPTVERFAATLSAWGIDNQTQVVAYDDASGVMAGRLWWMLRWLGHDAVAVLDGDLRAWQREGRPLTAGEERRAPRVFVPHPRPELQVSVEEVEANLTDGRYKLFDVRDEARSPVIFQEHTQPFMAIILGQMASFCRQSSCANTMKPCWVRRRPRRRSFTVALASASTMISLPWSTPG
jgi:thiosulfate/3-mercaptopyruvate sulfurtransferase